HPQRRRAPMGASPGQLIVPEGAPAPTVRVLSYAADELEERTIEDLSALRGLIDSPQRTVWIDIEGFGNRSVLEEIGQALAIHPLAMADVVNVPQRPKAELHDGLLLLIAQMARVTDSGSVDVEQVSFVLGPGWVASFQERPGDVFDPIRERIHTSKSRMRRMGADYLMYALIDAVIDGYFPVIETIAGVLDALEEQVIADPTHASLARIYATRRTILNLHRVQWGQRDAIHAILRDEEMPFSDGVKPYLRDAHDHAFQVLDAIETYRDMVIGLIDLYLSSASHRMNEVMKTLTIVATIFIPLTFLAGIYGMNFRYMPELQWRWAYPAFWAGVVGLGGALLLWFRHRGWIGSLSAGEGD
ncbi:MAG TPA: magnesium/cobalt transporter CorA, partial [Myxococcota bacterium]